MTKAIGDIKTVDTNKVLDFEKDLQTVKTGLFTDKSCSEIQSIDSKQVISALGKEADESYAERLKQVASRQIMLDENNQLVETIRSSLPDNLKSKEIEIRTILGSKVVVIWVEDKPQGGVV